MSCLQRSCFLILRKSWTIFFPENNWTSGTSKEKEWPFIKFNWISHPSQTNLIVNRHQLKRSWNCKTQIIFTLHNIDSSDNDLSTSTTDASMSTAVNGCEEGKPSATDSQGPSDATASSRRIWLPCGRVAVRRRRPTAAPAAPVGSVSCRRTVDGFWCRRPFRSCDRAEGGRGSSSNPWPFALFSRTDQRNCLLDHASTTTPLQLPPYRPPPPAELSRLQPLITLCHLHKTKRKGKQSGQCIRSLRLQSVSRAEKNVRFIRSGI